MGRDSYFGFGRESFPDWQREREDMGVKLHHDPSSRQTLFTSENSYSGHLFFSPLLPPLLACLHVLVLNLNHVSS